MSMRGSVDKRLDGTLISFIMEEDVALDSIDVGAFGAD